MTESKVDVLTQSAPERIWLQVDPMGDEEDRSEPLKEENWIDLSWHYEPIGGQEVEYVRADFLADLIEAAKDAECELAIQPRVNSYVIDKLRAALAACTPAKSEGR
jgi:hypothetical protein